MSQSHFKDQAPDSVPTLGPWVLYRAASAMSAASCLHPCLCLSALLFWAARTIHPLGSVQMSGRHQRTSGSTQNTIEQTGTIRRHTSGKRRSGDATHPANDDWPSCLAIPLSSLRLRPTASAPLPWDRRRAGSACGLRVLRAACLGCGCNAGPTSLGSDASADHCFVFLFLPWSLIHCDLRFCALSYLAIPLPPPLVHPFTSINQFPCHLSAVSSHLCLCLSFSAHPTGQQISSIPHLVRILDSLPLPSPSACAADNSAPIPPLPLCHLRVCGLPTDRPTG